MPAPDPPLTWDSGVTWDSGQTWDGQATAPQPKTKPMALIKLSLESLSRLEKVVQGETIAPKMTGNSAFPDAGPLVAILVTKTAALKAKLLAQEAAKQAAKEATEQATVAEEEYHSALNALADHAQSVSGGDATKLLSGGFDLRSEGAPTTMGQVTNLGATEGDDASEIDLSWDAVRGAKSYEVQSSPDPVTPTSWSHLGIATKSKITFAGLPSGAVCFFRVRAVGANGNGPWSDPAMKRIP